MKKQFQVVMYHYVRNLKDSRFPNLKGLDVERFRKQIEAFRKEYVFLKMEDVAAYYQGKQELPDNGILLTFDDGYKDCYTYVLPVLEEFQIKAAFFVPACHYAEKSLLEVNKIHLLLESVPIFVLLKEIKEFLQERFQEGYEGYYQRYAKASRYDTEEVVFVKRILQKGLPQESRTQLIQQLFATHINVSDGVLFEEFYLSLDQMKCMKRLGHHIGYHSFHHVWLNELSYEQQREELESAIQFFREQNIFDETLTLAYPYGAYNEDTLKVAEDLGIQLAFTVDPRVVDLEQDSPLEIPRFDTNDFL